MMESIFASPSHRCAFLAVALCATSCGMADVGKFGPAAEGSAGDSEGTDPLPPGIDRRKELVVVDPLVTRGAGADDAVEGAPWSFRTQLEWLAGSPERAPALARAWLEQWATVTSVGAARAPVTPRPAIQDVLLGPWEAMPGGVPSLERTPFRLVAIVNRVDLAGDPCDGKPGELRYVYSAGDLRNDAPLSMGVIVEVPYPATRTAHEWAEAWQKLSSLDGDAYVSALEELTTSVASHVDPGKARVRTDETAFMPQAGWELREFRVVETPDGPALRQVAIDTTPRVDVSPGALARVLVDAADSLRFGEFALPAELRAGVALLPRADFTWEVAGVEQELARAFSASTCNGCHGGNTEALPFQHIAPGRSWSEPPRLSRFLEDPAGTDDELARRAEIVSTFLHRDCDPVAGGYPGP